MKPNEHPDPEFIKSETSFTNHEQAIIEEFKAEHMSTISTDLDAYRLTVFEIKNENVQSSDDECIPVFVNNEKANEAVKCSTNVEKPHMCSVCGKTFFTLGHLRSHEQTHNESKDFTCLPCGKQFLTKSYLNRHMKSHLNERNYKCKVCQKGFNTSTTLGYHFRLVHSGETRQDSIMKEILSLPKIKTLQVKRSFSARSAKKDSR
jgi:uncharacterized Zn-finger protein